MIYLRMGKTTEAKPHQVNLRPPLLRIHYYQNKRLQVKESQYLLPRAIQWVQDSTKPTGFDRPEA